MDSLMNRYCLIVSAVFVGIGLNNTTFSATTEDDPTPNALTSDAFPGGMYTVPSVVSLIGTDANELIRFVNTQIDYNPQTSNLKSEKAVLISKSAGESDRTSLLASLLESAGYQVRWAEASGQSCATTRPQKRDEVYVPKLLETTALSSVITLNTIGDELYSQGLIGTEPIQALANSSDERFKVVLEYRRKEEEEWTSATGYCIAVTPRESIPDLIGDNTHFEISIAVIRESDPPRSEVVLQWSAGLADVEFLPIMLEFEMSEQFAKPVLHVGQEQVVGDQVQGLTSDVAGGVEELASSMNDMFSGIGAALGSQTAEDSAIEDVRYEIAFSTEGKVISRDFSLLGPLLGGNNNDDWKHALLASSHGILIVGSDPSSDFIDFIVEKEETSQSFASLDLYETNLAYFFFRSLLPNSPNRAGVTRVLNGPNVLVSSVYPDVGGKQETIALNLALKNYEVMHRDAQATFTEYLWNGLLDENAERLTVFFLGDRKSSLPPDNQSFAVEVTASRNALDSVPIAGRSRLSVEAAIEGNSVIVFPREELVDGEYSQWWEIDERGFAEDTNYWGGQSSTVEKSIIVSNDIKTAKAESRKALRVRNCFVQYAKVLLVIVASSAGQVSEAAAAVNASRSPIIQLLDEADDFIGKVGKERCKNRKAIEDAMPRSKVPRGKVRWDGLNKGLRGPKGVHNNKPWIQGGRVLPGKGRP